MSIDLNQLRDFLVAIANTEITELTLKSEEFELTFQKKSDGMKQNVGSTITEVTTSETNLVPSQTSTTPTAPETSPPSTPAQKKWLEITSPMVGTFYRAPAPQEDPFVEVGHRISVGQTVCIIEAMKLMNEIEAEVSGEVMEIVIENGQPVEYGQTLMWIKPDSKS